MPALRARRDFRKGLGVTIPASAVLSAYRAMAAPLRKKVKITDLPPLFSTCNLTPLFWQQYS